MVKKYAILFSFTLIAIIGIYFSNNAIKGKTVNVNAMKLDYTSIENTITCSGKIQAANGNNVFTDKTCIVNNVNVKIGDSVKAGDNLMTVIKSDINSPIATNALPLLGISNITNLSSLDKESVEAYKQIINNYSTSSNSKTDRNGDIDIENIVSPISGVVTAINVEDGSLVEQNTSVATISESNGLEISLPINETQISNVKEGQSAVITGSAFKNSEYHGTVNKISDTARQLISTSGQETVVDVSVSIDSDKYEDLKTGFTAKCKITTSTDEGMLVVPYTSVSAESDGREFVYRYVDDEAVKTYVNTGKEFSNGFQILDGLNVNDIIILEAQNIKDGDKVVINKMLGSSD